MRRLGSVAVTLALMALGLGAGLWLGSPASADPGQVQVNMPGDPANVFYSSTPKKLLDISALVPGGSISGTMDVKDASGNNAASGRVDAITLAALNVTYGDTCALPAAADCSAASHALASHLMFTLDVSGPGSVGTRTLSLSQLEVGALLGSGMLDGDILTATLTASLDFAGVGNDVQYGSVGFNLGLALDSSNAGGNGGGGDGGSGGGGIGPALAGTGNSDTSTGGTIEVGSENQEAAAGNQGGDTTGKPAGGKNVLVLGEHQALPNTGVPVVTLIAVGGAVLLLGLVLVFTARRRSRTAG